MTITQENTERQGSAVRLHIDVVVPTSADPGDVLGRLTKGALDRQGVTITLPEGDKVDVDLLHVQEVL